MFVIFWTARFPEEKVGINAGGELANISGADEEFMTGDLRVGRRLAQGRNEKLRPAMHR